MARNTIQQNIICETVKGMTNHPSPDDVYEAVHSKYPTIGRATVYRTLNKLAEKGEIRKVSMPDTADRFDFRTDEHVHIRCSKCNKVFDAEFEGVASLLTQLNEIICKDHHEELHGFQTDGINLSFYGICRECRIKEDNK